VRIDRKKLVCAMLDADLNAKQLAEKIGVSRATVCSIKNGKSCSEITAQKIADGLGLQLKNIIEWK